MSDDIHSPAATLRHNALECYEDYQQLVEQGEVLTYHDGTVANFATVYMASRLVHNGYADAFVGTDYWDNAWFADHLLNFIEAEIVSSTPLPDGQFALDLAFLMLSQVDWKGVAGVLSEVIAQQQEAMLRLKGKEVSTEVPTVESRSMSPEEWQKLSRQD